METRKRVLVCEDDPAQLLILAAAIGQAGFETTTARSAEEALKRTARAPADMMVTDVRLGSSSAFDLLAGLRKAGRDLPTLMISGSVTPFVREFAIREGVKGLLEKPCDLSSVVRVVRGLLATATPDAASPPGDVGPVRPPRARRMAVLVGPPEGRSPSAREAGRGRTAAAVWAGALALVVGGLVGMARILAG